VESNGSSLSPQGTNYENTILPSRNTLRSLPSLNRSRQNAPFFMTGSRARRWEVIAASSVEIFRVFQQPSVYAAENQDDLAILSDSHGEDDQFTKFITGPVLTLYHWLRSGSRAPLPIDPTSPPVGENQSNLHHYSDRQVEAVTNLLGTVFSSIAPLVSIVVLSFVSNAEARLGLVCAFTILFTVCLAVATKARRVEIFAATAAFASVQVVFIGTSNSTV